MTNPLHICRQYQSGVGHIDQKDGYYLVSFYGRRVAQTEAPTLEAARRELRQLADADDLADRVHRPGRIFA